MESARDRSTSIVPMRLYANWEVDRASSSSIQRYLFSMSHFPKFSVLSMVINKLALFKSLKSESNIVIAVRLQSNKRTLRSNDIALHAVNGDRLDLMVDVSFTIQVCTFYYSRYPSWVHIWVGRNTHAQRMFLVSNKYRRSRKDQVYLTNLNERTPNDILSRKKI